MWHFLGGAVVVLVDMVLDVLCTLISWLLLPLALLFGTLTIIYLAIWQQTDAPMPQFTQVGVLIYRPEALIALVVCGVIAIVLFVTYMAMNNE